jgi:hypothetical protein
MQKNMRLLVQTMRRSLEQENDMRWIIAGDGTRLVESRFRSKHPDLCRRASFYNHISPLDLAEQYKTSRIIFFSSLQEGFPNTLCEALCSGALFVGPKNIQAFEHCAKMGWGATYGPGQAEKTLLSEFRSHAVRDQASFQAVATDAQGVFYRHNIAQLLVDLATGSSANSGLWIGNQPQQGPS